MSKTQETLRKRGKEECKSQKTGNVSSGQDTAIAVATHSSYACLHWSHQHPGTDGEGTQGSLPYTTGLFATERVREGSHCLQLCTH